MFLKTGVPFQHWSFYKLPKIAFSIATLIKEKKLKIIIYCSKKRYSKFVLILFKDIQLLKINWNSVALERVSILISPGRCSSLIASYLDEQNEVIFLFKKWQHLLLTKNYFTKFYILFYILMLKRSCANISISFF